MRIRTGYSFRTAVGHLADVISRIKSIGWTVAPISDTNSTFGFNRYAKLAKAAGLRPIYGIELGVAAPVTEGRPALDRWTFFAKDSLRPLHDLIGTATTNCGRDPQLTYSQATAANGLIKITGERVQLQHIANPEDDLFIGLSPALPKMIYAVAHKRGFQFIATSDNVYPCQEQQEFYRITLGKRSNTQTYPQWILSDEEWLKACQYTASKQALITALRKRDAAMAQCVAELQNATLLVPEKPKTLRQMCIEGAQRTGTNLKDPIYQERLERELKMIADKEFEDYFYVIADMVNWAKQRMVVGPARGSSCGSLVCFLLNITTVDPIPFGLIFERFIDTTRKDLPDIDIDFSDQRRQLVFDYAEQKYGSDHVARLGTVGMFKPRSALNQAGIALQIPRWQVEKVLDGVIERSTGDSRALQALEDTLTDTEAGRKMLADFPEVIIAGRMEGHPNNASQHAAGIVITQEPITEYVAIDRRTKSAMIDKKDAEDLNLLKIDALGLTQLSIFERTLQLIGETDASGWLEKLPLNDQAAFDVLNKGHFAGVFQFMGGALQSLTKQVKITSIEDMIAITALARPGPMATGGANLWAKRRAGREQVTHIHPMLSELTKETLGIVIYQETVLKVGREIGNLSWEDVTKLRQAMAKSLGNEFFAQYQVKFIAGAAANGIDELTANSIWEQVNTMGSWAFNKAHAVAYGIVSYWCCWLKAHYPLEFAAATLDAQNDPLKQITLLRELKSEGIDYKSVDPEHSTERWMPINGKMLVGPLTAIKGIGPTMVLQILAARKAGLPVRPSIMKRLINAKTEIDTLYPVAERAKQLLQKIKIVSTPTQIIKVQCGLKNEFVIVGVVKKIAPKDENEAINVARRNGRVLTGQTKALNLFFQDDTDEIFGKIERQDFERFGVDIIERGRPGKAIYAVKGVCPPTFRMIKINNIKYLGDLDGSVSESGTKRG